MTTDLEMDIAREQERKTLDIGQSLRAKRLTLAIDERQVATQLKLSIEHVYALENNDFIRFRSTTFARGYIKSYCRLLGEDHRPVLAAFDEQQSVKESNIRPVDNVKSQASGRDPIFVIVSAIIVAIIAFVAFWWPAQSSEPDVQQDPVVQEQSAELNGNQNSTPVEEEPVETDAPTGDQAAPELNEPEVDLESLDLSALSNIETQTVLDEAADVVTGLSAETIALLEDAGVDPQDVVEATREPEPVPAPIEIESPAFNHDIVMTFDADCWTQVRDSTGRVIFSGVKSAGSSLELDGQAPYRVTLGYARGVTELLYKGEPFDFSTYIRKDLARFELE